jgi:hypothetical protein
MKVNNTPNISSLKNDCDEEGMAFEHLDCFVMS